MVYGVPLAVSEIDTSCWFCKFIEGVYIMLFLCSVHG